MMTIEDVYPAELPPGRGCCSFATPDGHGGVEARIAHFFAYGDEGLYLRTMDVKPFYRQLKESGRLAVCGERTEAKVVFDEDNLPLFKPGYQMRVSGEVRELSMVEVEAKAAHDRDFNVAVHDIAKYPETRVLVLHRFHGELYDYDYAMARRDHKLYRERFAFGGDTFEEPGLADNGQLHRVRHLPRGLLVQGHRARRALHHPGRALRRVRQLLPRVPRRGGGGQGEVRGPASPHSTERSLRAPPLAGIVGRHAKPSREENHGHQTHRQAHPRAAARSAGSRSSSSPSSWAWATRPCRSGSAGAAAPTCRFCPRSRPSWDAR